ncbi:MAG: VWA domain-containing protein [Lachnospiraceae bacterium]|nr:VWA domain-containing protein [Lachnospiraceae bacterium]
MKKGTGLNSVIAMAVITSVLSGCGQIRIEGTASPAAAPQSDTAAAESSENSGEKVYFGCYVPEGEDYEEYEPACEESAVEDAFCYDDGRDLSAEYGNYDSYSEACEEYIQFGHDEGNAGFASSKMEGSYLDGLYDSYGRNNADLNGGETYEDISEQGFRSVRSHPLSTFAADVDTASYANLRRMLYDGYRLSDIPEGAVRPEELINYFHYDYKGPKGSEPFGVNTEISDCPWNEDALLLSIGLKTEDIDFSEAPDSNLVFLIDVSGSMSSPDKLPLLQESFCMLTDELSAKDRVSIVTYANGSETVLAGERGDNKHTIKRAVNHLYASGGTNGGEGIKTAYALAEKHFIKGGNNRVILATDGDLNLGLTSVDELNWLIGKKKESGVYLSVLGFGTGNINDSIMQNLADNGNGNYSYIDSEKEAEKVLVKELSANMLTVCKDVKLQAEFDPEVIRKYRLIGYSNRIMKDRDFDNDRKDGGEIGAGHEVTALYELIPAEDGFSRKDVAASLSIRFKRPSEDESSLLEYPITFDSYRRSPSDEFLFRSAVAEFALLASDSLYSEDADMDNIIERLGSIGFDDDDKAEFYKLVSNIY